MLKAWPPPGPRKPNRRCSCLLAIVALLLSPAAWTDEKVGLVLSGGGARGLAHIGVIKALEELGITIHAVAGTSMGGIVGALYASGKTTEEIEHVANNLNWAEAFSDQPERDKLSFRRKQDSREYLVKAHATFDGGVLSLPKGIVQGQNLQLLLQRQFVHVSHITDFDKLPIPFRVVAADIVTGDAVVLGSGSLPSSVRASMSVPGIFAPVELNDRMLVDGGIANNLPVDVAKEMGVDRVIAIDITSPLLNAEQLDSVIPIIEQLTTLLTYNQMKARLDLLGENDVLITPDLSGLPASAFDRPGDLIERGYEAAMAMRGQLERIAAVAATREITRTAASQPPTVAGITISNDSSISDKLILAQIGQATGTPLDRDALEEDLASVYGYDYFESVNYRLRPGKRGSTLAINVREKSWGRDLLGVSFEIFSDSNGDASYNIAANYRKARITRRGGEWFSVAQIGQNTSLRSEFYLPVDYKQRYFLRPYASYGERLFDSATNNHVVSRAKIANWTSGLFAGREISNKVILGVGVESHVGNAERLVGADTVDVNYRDQVTYLLLEADSLNNLYFPNEGIVTTVRYDRVRPTGGRERFDRLTAELTAAVAMGPHSLVLGTRYVGTDSTAAGIHQMANLGGFLNLSGVRRASLNDMSQLFASLTYLHRLDQQSILPVDLPVYVGVSLEAGNVFPDRAAITGTDLIGSASLMLALDSPLGPLYFGYGRADGGDSAFYLKLGRLF